MYMRNSTEYEHYQHYCRITVRAKKWANKQLVNLVYNKTDYKYHVC